MTPFMPAAAELRRAMIPRRRQHDAKVDRARRRSGAHRRHRAVHPAIRGRRRRTRPARRARRASPPPPARQWPSPGWLPLSRAAVHISAVRTAFAARRRPLRCRRSDRPRRIPLRATKRNAARRAHEQHDDHRQRLNESLHHVRHTRSQQCRAKELTRSEGSDKVRPIFRGRGAPRFCPLAPLVSALCADRARASRRHSPARCADLLITAVVAVVVLMASPVHAASATQTPRKATQKGEGRTSPAPLTACGRDVPVTDEACQQSFDHWQTQEQRWRENRREFANHVTYKGVPVTQLRRPDPPLWIPRLCEQQLGHNATPSGLVCQAYDNYLRYDWTQHVDGPNGPSRFPNASFSRAPAKVVASGTTSSGICTTTDPGRTPKTGRGFTGCSGCT